MHTESIEAALKEWAQVKGYETYLKVLPSAPEIFSGTDEELQIEGLFGLFRLSHDEFKTERTYFTKKRTIQSRKKAPSESDYILAVWASPLGIVRISESLIIKGGGTKGTRFQYNSDTELVRCMDKSYGALNRNHIFLPAVKKWLKKNKKITSVEDLEGWPNSFMQPDKLAVPFQEWSIIRFLVNGVDGFQYLGVTNDGRLGLFEGEPLSEVVLVENLNSGDARVTEALMTLL